MLCFWADGDSWLLNAVLLYNLCGINVGFDVDLYDRTEENKSAVAICAHFCGGGYDWTINISSKY